MRLTFQGTETRSIECQGSFSLEHARQLVPPSLELQTHEGKAVLGLLYFQMHKLSLTGAGGLPAWPMLAFSYQELLWRVGVVLDGAPAWFGLCCEFNDRAVAASAALLFQYTTAHASFTHAPNELRVSGKCITTIHSRPTTTTEAQRPQRLLVSRRGLLYEVYWDERPATLTRRAQMMIQSDRALRDLRWREEGLVLQGRTHICGAARRHR